MPTARIPSTPSDLHPPPTLDVSMSSPSANGLPLSNLTPTFPPGPAKVEARIAFPIEMRGSANQLTTLDAGDKDTLTRLNGINRLLKDADRDGEINFSNNNNEIQLYASFPNNYISISKPTLQEAAIELEKASKKTLTSPEVSETVSIDSPFRNKAGQVQRWPKQFSDGDKQLLVALKDLANSLDLKLEQVNDTGNFTLTFPVELKKKKPPIKYYNLTGSNEADRSKMLEILTTDIKDYAQSKDIKVKRSSH